MANEVNDLSEEVFCLKYEVETLAGVLLRRQSERWVPGFLYDMTEHSHIDRYKLACLFSRGKHVIDIACGTGKGSYLIATQGNAKQVDGFDIQEDAIRYAAWRNASANLRFAVKDAEALEIYNQYDLAVSFETVEHLPNYRNFFLSIRKCLKPDGLFLISTPISASVIDHSPSNPYHVQEWGFLGFQSVVAEYFDLEKIYVQLYPKKQEPERVPSVLRRVFNKIKRRLKTDTTAKAAINSLDNRFSTIEEFTGQFNMAELGSSRIGYQIILARNKVQ